MTSSSTDDDARLYTLEELADLADMTPRNVRAHQTRGLVDMPVPHGRSVRYTHSHLTRLRLIDALQRRGFTLESIQRMLERSESYAAMMLQHRDELRRSKDDGPVAAVLDDEVPYSEQGMDLVRAVDPTLPDAFVRAGLIRQLPDGSFRGSGSLAAATMAFAGAGADIVALNTLMLQVVTAAESAAATLVDDLMATSTDAARIDAQTPLGVQLYAIAFEITLGRAVERMVAERLA